jgi:hypothetical protein
MPSDLTLPHYLDSTMIATFRSCRRKFYWQFIRNLVLDGQNIHLTAGGAIAASLDHIRRTQFGHPPLYVDHLLASALPTFLSAWGDLVVDPDHPKSIHRTIHALEAYITQYHPASDEIQPLERTDGSPTSEFTFAIPLPVLHPSGDPFIYCGRFDLLGRHTINSRVVIVDEKTTGSLGANWTRQWDLRGQFLGYTWACQQLGFEVYDCIVRGIGMYKTGPQFLSVPVNFPNHLIDRWYQQLLATTAELVWCFENDSWSYDFADACSSYGGCPYVDLCRHREPEPWFSNYTTRTWSPVAHAESLT